MVLAVQSDQLLSYKKHVKLLYIVHVHVETNIFSFSKDVKGSQKTFFTIFAP